MNSKIAGGLDPTRGSRHFWALAFALFVVLLVPSRALAEPVAYYQLPGTSSEWITKPTVGSDGTLWVAQSLSWGTSNSERHTRLLHLGPSGNVISSTGAIEGDPYGVGLTPATDGGVWEVSSGKLWHVEKDGSTQEISLPHGVVYPGDLVSGSDGRAWLAACEFLYSEPREERCGAAAVSLDGEVQTIPMPGLTTVMPAGTNSWSGISRALATATGVWFWKRSSVNGGPAVSSAEFVSYAGAASAVSIAANWKIAAPASGGSVWWLVDEGKSGATFGQVTPAGTTSDVHHVGNVSMLEPENDPFVTGVGRSDNLLWAQNATWSDTYDGQIGVSRPDGSGTEYKVAHNATAVPTTTPNFWSGSCTFGIDLYEAVDGALWTISAGHPSRVTRQQTSGAFETYLLDGASEFAGEKETAILGMAEASPSSLYFSLNAPSGPVLARLNPLSPPPAEPRYPDYGTIVKEGRTNRVQSLLRSLIRQARSSVGRLRYGTKKPKMRANFPEPGAASVLVKRSGERGATLLSATASGSSGSHQMHVRVEGNARALLRSKTRKRAHGTVTVTFTPRGGRPVRRIVKIGL